MTHFIIEGGLFDRFMNEVIASGFSFPCEVAHPTPQPATLNGKFQSTKRDPSKAKFYCPSCGQVARANYLGRLKCGRPRCKSAFMLVEW